MENVCFSDPFSVLLAKRCLKTKYFSKVAYFEMLRLRQKLYFCHLIVEPPEISLNFVFPLYMKILDIDI